MAKFQSELPNDLIKEFEKIYDNTFEMMGAMTKAGAEVVYKNVKNNMSKVFDTTNSLDKGLMITKTYKTPSDDGVNNYVGFYGYVEGSKPTKRHPKGTPIPLVAMAREYGSSKTGEAKKPFFRKSFNKKEIEQAMMSVQDKYINGD